MSVTISGSGQIIKQVIQVVLPTRFTTTSTSFIDITGLSATITPTNSANKILVTYGVYGGNSAVNSSLGMLTRMVRGATVIGVGTLVGSETAASGGNWLTNNNYTTFQGNQYLDSPATTSATTYKIQMIVEGGTYCVGGSYLTAGAYNSSIQSYITLMEVAYA